VNVTTDRTRFDGEVAQLLDFRCIGGVFYFYAAVETAAAPTVLPHRLVPDADLAQGGILFPVATDQHSEGWRHWKAAQEGSTLLHVFLLTTDHARLVK
jgi:hypothetical protein